MLEVLWTANNLEELHLLHCKYVTGICLGQLVAQNKLHTINLAGSYSIESNYLLEAAMNNKDSLKVVRLDGENMSESDVIELLQHIKKDSLESFRLYFGSEVEDEFLLLL